LPERDLVEDLREYHGDEAIFLEFDCTEGSEFRNSFTPFYLYLYNRLRSTWYAARNIVENSAPSARYSAAMRIFTSIFVFGAVEKSLRLGDDIVCCHAE
jgi:hypothetical protein